VPVRQKRKGSKFDDSIRLPSGYMRRIYCCAWVMREGKYDELESSFPQPDSDMLMTMCFGSVISTREFRGLLIAVLGGESLH
jgi:hypothetical protein